MKTKEIINNYENEQKILMNELEVMKLDGKKSPAREFRIKEIDYILKGIYFEYKYRQLKREYDHLKGKVKNGK